MEKQLQIISVLDPFNRNNKEIRSIAFSGQTIRIMRKEHFPADLDVIVSLNGKVISLEKYDLCLRPGDCLVMIPEIQGGGGGGGGKQILHAILAIAVIVIAPQVGLAALTAAAGATGAAGLPYLIGEAIYWGATIGTAVAGGMLLNTIFAPPTPEVPVIKGDMTKSSPTYGWAPQTIQEQGSVIPRFYGLNRLYGNIIATKTEFRDDKQYLNVLISLGMGPMKRLFDFKINNQPSSVYGDISIGWRAGKITQGILPGFEETVTGSAPQSTTLPGNTKVIRTTAGNVFNELRVEVTALGGLWYANDKGDLDGYRVDIRCRIRNLTTAGPWRSITNHLVSKQLSAGGQWHECLYHPGYSDDTMDEPSWWECSATGNTDPNAHEDGEQSSTVLNYRTKRYKWVGSAIYVGNVTEDYTYITGNKTSPIVRTFYARDLEPGQYEIEVEKLTADQTNTRYGDDIALTNIQEITYDDFTYPRKTLVAVTARATDQLSGSINLSCLAECTYLSVYDGTQWNVEFSCNPAWVVWDILTQPVYKDEAIGKSNISTTAAGVDIWRYDGFDPSKLDLIKFKEWADFCGDVVKAVTCCITASSTGVRVNGSGFSALTPGDFIKHGTKGIRMVTEILSDTALYITHAFTTDLSSESISIVEIRCTFNGGFDVEMDMWTSAMKVAQIGRGQLIKDGTKYTVAIDKSIAGDLTQPAQLFSAGNIYKDTFKETFLPKADRAAEIEINFLNADKEYSRDTLSVFNPGIDNPTNRVNLQLFGITKVNEAWRAGMLRLYQNQYILRTIEFDVDVDAIACTAGDVIYFQHEVPQWGYGGRIVSGTESSITLDRTVQIAHGQTHEILIRLSDDTIVQKQFTEMTAGETNVLTLDTGDTFATVPEQFDVYTFGLINVSNKEFRVLDITRSQELRRKIRAIEYVEAVYNVDTDTPVVPDNTIYSALVNMLQGVTNLTAKELLVKRPDGTIDNTVMLTFDISYRGEFVSADVYCRKTNTPWTYLATTTSDSYRIENVTALDTYTFAVLRRNKNNHMQSIYDGTKVSLYIYGKTAPPEDVTNFTGQASLNGLELKWNPVSDVDVSHYVIRWSTQTSGVLWTAALELNRTDSTTLTVPAALDGTYLIKAVDTSGIESENATAVVTTIPGVINFNALYIMTEDPVFTGTKVETVITAGDLEIAEDGSGNVKAFGSYETGIYDLGSLQIVRVSVDFAVVGVDKDNTFNDITDFDAVTDLDGATIPGINCELQIAVSTDGSTFGSWMKFTVGDYSARKVKFRAVLTSSDPRKNIRLTKLAFKIDMPDRIESSAGVAIGAMPVAINFSKTFKAVPVISMTLHAAAAGDYLDLTLPAVTGFTIAVRDVNGTLKAGTIDWRAEGY